MFVLGTWMFQASSMSQQIQWSPGQLLRGQVFRIELRKGGMCALVMTEVLWLAHIYIYILYIYIFFHHFTYIYIIWL